MNLSRRVPIERHAAAKRSGLENRWCECLLPLPADIYHGFPLLIPPNIPSLFLALNCVRLCGDDSVTI